LQWKARNEARAGAKHEDLQRKAGLQKLAEAFRTFSKNLRIFSALFPRASVIFITTFSALGLPHFLRFVLVSKEILILGRQNSGTGHHVMKRIEKLLITVNTSFDAIKAHT
jgi:hypothetical protein